MSVRAYRINNIDHEEENTFNLWHHPELVEFLDREDGIYDSLVEGSGITEVSVRTLKKALKEVKKLEDWVRDNIKRDIKWAKANKEEYIQYYCF
jgi:hypothetical protein